MERLKELAHGVIYLWWGIWTLFVFTWIVLFGEMRVVEPNHWILLVEYLLCLGGIILGIERLIKDIKH